MKKVICTSKAIFNTHKVLRRSLLIGGIQFTVLVIIAVTLVM